MSLFLDLGDEQEDDRINAIGNAAMSTPGTVAFITDADPGKAERYIAKIKERFPFVRIVARHPGPVKDTVSVIVQRKLKGYNHGFDK